MSALSVSAASQPGPVGLWLTDDGNGVIAITSCGEALCGRITGIVLDHPNDPTPVDHAGRSQCGLPLIDDAVESKPGIWTGHITDPRNGDVYHPRLWLDAQGRLHLRGYIGIPLRGETCVWTRYSGRVPTDRRFSAAVVAGAR